MSTRARIAVVLTNGKVASIYSHSDGYPEGVGMVLLENYTSGDKIRKLVSMGDISYIGDGTLDSVRSYFGWREEDAPFRKNYNEDEFWDNAFNCCEEYAYIYKDEKWYYKGWNDRGLKLLTKEIVEA